MATFSVTHPQCGATTVVRAGHGDVIDFDAALDCNPGFGCCGQDHHHGQQANACHGQHDGEPCPHPDPLNGCTVSTEQGQACPGGHCGGGVAGCAVCRPITITVLDLGLQPTLGA